MVNKLIKSAMELVICYIFFIISNKYSFVNNYLTFTTPTDERKYHLLYLGDWVDGDVLYMKLTSIKKL